jgi:nucleotide-binding universal stress UspA family protein
VLEAPDTAGAIIDYAQANEVDHIIIGSRGSSAIRRYLGSVSAQVVAEANCTVTVVKHRIRSPEPALCLRKNVNDLNPSIYQSIN